MTSQHIRRVTALLVSAAILVSATVATPTSAATPNCRGFVATIVGTKGPDVLVGTARRDVIVGRGGNDIIDGRGGDDIICGGPGADQLVGRGGRDKLYGNSGPDRVFGGVGNDWLLGGVDNDQILGGVGNDALFGQAGNDRLFGQAGMDALWGQAGSDRLFGQDGNDALRGGSGTDTCYQGQGRGLHVSCELPVAPLAPAPAPAPTPAPTQAPAPPAGPSLVPLAGMLAVAYTDMNDNHAYDVEDVLISKLVDTNGDKVPSIGDTILMGRYPTAFEPGPSDFGDWGVKSHPVEGFVYFSGSEVVIDTEPSGPGGYEYKWFRDWSGIADRYREVGAEGVVGAADSQDGITISDWIWTDPESASEPDSTLRLNEGGHDSFVEVELNYPWSP